MAFYGAKRTRYKIPQGSIPAFAYLTHDEHGRRLCSWEGTWGSMKVRKADEHLNPWCGIAMRVKASVHLQVLPEPLI